MVIAAIEFHSQAHATVICLGINSEISCDKSISEAVVLLTESVTVAIKSLGLEKEDKTKALHFHHWTPIDKVATMLSTSYTRNEFKLMILLTWMEPPLPL